MEAVKRFLLWTGRISAIIAAVILLLFVGGWLLYKGYDGYGKLKTKGLSEVRTWDSLTVESMNAGFVLRTKWRDGQMLYKMDVKFKDEKSRDKSPEADNFTIVFYDKDGFKLFEDRISRGSVTGRVDESGRVVVVEVESFVYVSESDYRKAEKWNVSWVDPD